MYTIYSKPGCVNCDRAKALMTSREIPFTEITVDVGQEKEVGKTYLSVSELRAKFPGASSVPLFEKDGAPVGGYKEFLASV